MRLRARWETSNSLVCVGLDPDRARFPDAFVGTMAQLLCAVEDGSVPEINGRDNLETLALCEAVFEGAKEHRVTRPKEFLN